MHTVLLNVIVQNIFQSVQVIQLFGLAMTAGESERQVDTGIGGSFLCLQRAEELLAEREDQLIMGFFCLCRIKLKRKGGFLGGQNKGK